MAGGGSADHQSPKLGRQASQESMAHPPQHRSSQQQGPSWMESEYYSYPKHTQWVPPGWDCRCLLLLCLVQWTGDPEEGAPVILSPRSLLRMLLTDFWRVRFSRCHIRKPSPCSPATRGLFPSSLGPPRVHIPRTKRIFMVG